MINILLILARDAADHPLLGRQSRLDPTRFRVVTHSLGGAGSPTAHRRRKRWYSPHFVDGVRRKIEDESIDIVHSHLYKPTLTTVLAARRVRRASGARRRPAIVATIHGLGSSRTLLRRLLNRYFLRRVDRIVAVCDAVRRDVLDANPWLAPEKVVVVRNGLDYDAFPAGIDRNAARATIPLEKKDGFWFGAATRLNRGKNVHTLIAAFRSVAAVNTDAQLVVAGTGPEKRRLETQVRAAGLGSRVAFLGFRNDIPRVLRAIDCFVHTSLREGIPLSLLEAMASGLPAVASDRGGIPEVFGETAMGSLVNPDDSAAVASAMEKMVRSGREERAAMGERARERALSAFGASGMVAALERLYEEVRA